MPRSPVYRLIRRPTSQLMCRSHEQPAVDEERESAQVDHHRDVEPQCLDPRALEQIQAEPEHDGYQTKREVAMADRREEPLIGDAHQQAEYEHRNEHQREAEI